MQSILLFDENELNNREKLILEEVRGWTSSGGSGKAKTVTVILISSDPFYWNLLSKLKAMGYEKSYPLHLDTQLPELLEIFLWFW